MCPWLRLAALTVWLLQGWIGFALAAAIALTGPITGSWTQPGPRPRTDGDRGQVRGLVDLLARPIFGATLGASAGARLTGDRD
jgi:hypothetical protein